MNTSIEPHLLELIKSLVSEKIGLALREGDEKRFCEVILARVKQHKLLAPDDYYLKLNSNTLTANRNGVSLYRCSQLERFTFSVTEGNFKFSGNTYYRN